MNAQNKKNALAIGLTILVMALSACGQPKSNPASSLASSYDSTTTTTDNTSDFSNDPTTDTSLADATTSVEPDPTAPVIVDPSPEVSPSPTPSALPTLMPTPAPLMGDTFVENVQKSYPGIFMWEKCKVTFQLRNASWLRTLRERLVVTFTHKGEVVEVKEVQVQLSPAKISNYTFESTKHADDASVVTYAN
ncbi:MAG TPA: hypothetical protein DD435_03010 [Cyanobacteria bacterium UBA8530]|nr:hypothetical protein [Cyanobacteria bacterium UBA8530]